MVVRPWCVGPTGAVEPVTLCSFVFHAQPSTAGSKSIDDVSLPGQGRTWYQRAIGNRPWPTAETLRRAGTKELDHALYGDYDVRVQGATAYLWRTVRHMYHRARDCMPVGLTAMGQMSMIGAQAAVGLLSEPRKWGE